MIKVCFKYSTSFINLVSIALSVTIVVLFSFGIEKVQNRMIQKQENQEISSKTIVKEIEQTKEENLEVNDKLENKEIEEAVEFDWYIEIPKIKLYAPIEEGTEDEVLDRSVGHFESTSRRNGNCGLAAHNRGYSVNYFANVKELEEGDTIVYFVDGRKYKYKVTEIAIIYETDWSYLEETEDSRITLITCVENRGEYRLCVQGALVQEEE